MKFVETPWGSELWVALTDKYCLKIIVFKKRRRHNYRRRNGHRQWHTILKITAIGDHKAETKAKKTKAAPEAAPAAAEA